MLHIKIICANIVNFIFFVQEIMCHRRRSFLMLLGEFQSTIYRSYAFFQSCLFRMIIINTLEHEACLEMLETFGWKIL